MLCYAKPGSPIGEISARLLHPPRGPRMRKRSSKNVGPTSCACQAQGGGLNKVVKIFSWDNYGTINKGLSSAYKAKNLHKVKI